MEDDIKLSVVIPARNARSTIGRAIRSIRNQSTKPHEVIVVDNGSTDNTAREALLHGADLNLRVVSCETPGSGAARNSGIQASEGDIIAFLDADDVWYPEKIKCQMAKVNDRDSTFSGTYMHYLSSTGRILGNNVRFRDDATATQAIRTGEAMPVPLSSVLVSRRLIETVGLFNASFRRAQDLEWLTRVAGSADLTIASDRPLVGYVLQAGSSSDDSYVEQGMASDAIRAALKLKRAPNYQLDVIERLNSGPIPRKYAAGKHYRRAGALIGERKFLRAGAELLSSALIDLPGTVAKLQWQSVGRASGPLDPETAVLFTGQFEH